MLSFFGGSGRNINILLKTCHFNNEESMSSLNVERIRIKVNIGEKLACFKVKAAPSFYILLSNILFMEEKERRPAKEATLICGFEVGKYFNSHL